ncbi:hypothetical protein Rs2_04903 [Raphanus sativus]|nr:hypothetical protein Rs2_04903 [Raphanus sativus]
MDQLFGTNDESNKKPRVSYTREFLLSLSDKDVCKKLPNLPSEFNDLLLRDSQDPSPGDFVTHGLRRNDYSSSPPTRARGEFGSNSRGSHGRWEGRSGGWTDKDADSHSDRDPGEPGRRSGMPSRRPWQSPEHDGLLGKGSFPKPSGPRPQSNDSYQLSRTNEPYHPPRPYKFLNLSCAYVGAPYTRRDTRDSLNDETFGSSDSTNEDRAEEERKRRASFELLRKEHQKVFQIYSNALRPSVPPGFASTVLERKQGDKPQAETSQHEHSPLNPKGINMVNGTNGEKPSVFKIGSGEMLVEDEAVRVNSGDTSEHAVTLSSFLGISTHNTVNKDKSFEKLSSISTAAEVPGYPRKFEQATVKLDQKKSLEISNGPSILDKIFDTAINLNSGDSSITQKIVERVEETRSPQTVKSSKFAHLFLEEDNKPVEDLPSSRPPGGLLSLLQSADKLQTFDTKASKDQGHATKNIDKLSNSSASKSVTAAPPVLTCEDLEQSILSQVDESDTYGAQHPPIIYQYKRRGQAKE